MEIPLMKDLIGLQYEIKNQLKVMRKKILTKRMKWSKNKDMLNYLRNKQFHSEVCFSTSSMISDRDLRAEAISRVMVKQHNQLIRGRDRAVTRNEPPKHQLNLKLDFQALELAHENLTKLSHCRYCKHSDKKTKKHVYINVLNTQLKNIKKYITKKEEIENPKPLDIKTPAGFSECEEFQNVLVEKKEKVDKLYLCIFDNKSIHFDNKIETLIPNSLLKTAQNNMVSCEHTEENNIISKNVNVYDEVWLYLYLHYIQEKKNKLTRFIEWIGNDNKVNNTNIDCSNPYLNNTRSHHNKNETKKCVFSFQNVLKNETYILHINTELKYDKNMSLSIEDKYASEIVFEKVNMYLLGNINRFEFNVLDKNELSIYNKIQQSGDNFLRPINRQLMQENSLLTSNKLFEENMCLDQTKQMSIHTNIKAYKSGLVKIPGMCCGFQHILEGVNLQMLNKIEKIMLFEKDMFIQIQENIVSKGNRGSNEALFTKLPGTLCRHKNILQGLYMIVVNSLIRETVKCEMYLFKVTGKYTVVNINNLGFGLKAGMLCRNLNAVEEASNLQMVNFQERIIKCENCVRVLSNGDNPVMLLTQEKKMNKENKCLYYTSGILNMLETPCDFLLVKWENFNLQTVNIEQLIRWYKTFMTTSYHTQMCHISMNFQNSLESDGNNLNLEGGTQHSGTEGQRGDRRFASRPEGWVANSLRARPNNSGGQPHNTASPTAGLYTSSPRDRSGTDQQPSFHERRVSMRLNRGANASTLDLTTGPRNASDKTIPAPEAAAPPQRARPAAPNDTPRKK